MGFRKILKSFSGERKFVRRKKPSNQIDWRALYSRWDLNPYGPYSPLDFKSSVSTNSTTRALEYFLKLLSERRDLNPRPPPWQGDALPLSYFRNCLFKNVAFRSTNCECKYIIYLKISNKNNGIFSEDFYS